MTTITKYLRDDAAGVTSSVFTITPPSAGGAYVLFFDIPSAISVVSVVDSASGVPDLEHTSANQGGTGNIFVYRRSNINDAPTTVTVTYSASVAVRPKLLVIDGMATSSPLSAITEPADTGYATVHTHSFTTLTDNEIPIIVYTGSGGAATAADTAGWTMWDTNDRNPNGLYSADAGVAGAKTVQTTSDGGTVRKYRVLSYKSAAPSGATISTITGTTPTEAGNAVFTTTMSGTGGGTFAYSWSGTATSADYTTTLTTGMCAVTGGSGSVTVSGSNITVDSTVTAFTVTVPTTTDTLDEANETIRLVIGGVTSSSGTINDDDAPPTITGTASSTVTAGDPLVITYSPGLSGQTRTYTLALTDGTAVGGTDYDNTTVTGDFAVTAGTGSVSISGSTVTVDPGVTEFTLTITTT